MSEISSVLQVEIGEQQLLIETGNLAGQADGAVTVRYGDTLVLVTACVGRERREREELLPLTVDFEERLYAAGKIPGSFFRREGRPGQEATLAARLIDRPIRPLFPKGFYNEIQVVATVLSADQENNPDTLAIVGASVALGISPIPFAGPVSAVRVGYVDDEFVANPTFTQLARSRLDLVVAGTRDAVIMVEAGAKEVSEGIVLEAIKFGQVINREIIEAQEAFIETHGRPKMEFEAAPPNDGLQQEASAVLQGLFPEGIAALKRAERQRREALAQEKLAEQLGDTCSAQEISVAVDAWVKSEIRASVLEKGIRVGGRGLNEIRPIKCAVGTLPRTHGSGLFSRGETQVLSITTLGSLRQTQVIDSIGPEENRRYMHHYNFAPFSTGEVKRIGTGRREIGHGALAERALLPVIPDEEIFPYTIRIVSEVLSSNGSTSMASVCGSTLSLMDAGVPIKAPVAGIAMGLITGEDGRYGVLTDIEGIEDFFGDMDFKVAGTAEGITAVQMDLKTKEITYEIIEAGLKQALAGRLFILECMKDTISASHTELSRYAPKMTRITIDPEKVRNVIGPGGRVIRSITEETGATIDVENDGTVTIGAPDEESAQKAISIIDGLTRDPKVGEIYTGKVTSITGFGAFVEILPGRDGLVHISELANYRVAQVEDVVKMGDEITVIVLGIDPQGKIKLSRRAVFEKHEPGARPEGAQRGPSRGPLRDTGPRYREGEARGDRRPTGPRDARPRQPFTRRPDPRK
ncbi:MAG TPA: polyribonucleotide nucleotidyltransferase [Dehalococcoidia bacterium]|nr:polyribonucleotide nucleotidyltransferase [Dehalococcoidia bacterium]